MASGLAAIEHIVVLMLENRSFDHMLGSLTLGGRADVDGLDRTQFERFLNLRFEPLQLKSQQFLDDPGHSFDDVRAQLDPGRGFVWNFFRHVKKQDLRDIMGYYTPEDLPAFSFLAQEYAVCDRWFSSVPGPTHPNRLFAMAGHSAGRVKNDLAAVGGYRMRTIFELLGDAPTDWQFFYHDVPTLWLFERYFGRKGGMIRHFDEFADEVGQGKLAKVTWIDPHYGILPLTGNDRHLLKNDDHPEVDITPAQGLVRTVYTSLLNAPDDLWSRTLLVVTYDEHGGFYDHVLPPSSGDRRNFARYGVRVPTLVASARTPAGLCLGSGRAGRVEQNYDHTSILKTIFNRFLPGRDGSELSPRVARARDLSDFLSAPQPREDRPQMPEIPAVQVVAMTEEEAALDEDINAVSFEESLRVLALMAVSERTDLSGV